MLLPDPLEPTSAVVDAGRRVEGTSFSTGTPGVVLEGHVLELDFAADVGQRRARRVFLVFGGHLQNLVDAVEAGERFGDLRADRRDLT